MAAAGLALAAQLAPAAIQVTEAITKATLLAQQVKSANLMNQTQWMAIWDMADTQFLGGYDAVMGLPQGDASLPSATASTATTASHSSTSATTAATTTAPVDTTTTTAASVTEPAAATATAQPAATATAAETANPTPAGA